MNCKEKLEEAKRLYKFSNDDQRHVLEDLFPELKKKEDKDEKIRIAILNYLRKMWANCKDNVCGVHVEDAIAWLEKQGEQKTNDNVEAKFKVGDWIIGGIYNKPTQITKIEKEGYVTDRGWIGFSFSFVEDMRLWTLQDAKDGDILVSKYNQPFIYNGNRNFCHVGSYCGLSTSDKFIVSTSKYFWTENVSIRPATKEQHELLFKEMKEAGYEWDSEKKELKKINTFCQENCKGFQETGKCFADGECKAKKEAEQKSTWSKEDESNWNNIWDVLDGRFELSDYGYKEAAKWFLENCPKGFKSFRPQPKKEWSEEDEKMFSELLSSLLINTSDKWVKYGEWLKSLKGRITWKPTEAQLASLTIVCDRNDRIGFDLTQLLQELKKL